MPKTKAKLLTVLIVISAGCAEVVELPDGVRVVIRDYDIEGNEWEGDDLETDEDGNEYQELVFEND